MLKEINISIYNFYLKQQNKLKQVNVLADSTFAHRIKKNGWISNTNLNECNKKNGPNQND